LTEADARRFAVDWIDAWNARDLNRILSHYSSDAVFSSPFVAALEGETAGCIRGREALQRYFGAALGTYPTLAFRLRAVFRGVETLTLLYDSVDGLVAAETMVVNEAGQVTRVWAQYDDNRETRLLPVKDT
jgi:SnoaL-like protein